MDEHQISSQAAFAKKTNIPPSTLSRWISDPTVTPEPYMLARVADRLTVRRVDRDRTYANLMAAAGHIADGPVEVDADELPPSAREVAALLGDQSPLAPNERERLGELLDILLRSYRKLSPDIKATR